MSGVRTEIGVDEAVAWPAAVAGDGSAFALVYDLHADRVFRHASRLVATVHDAEDVTAAAFFELWRRRADVRVVGGSVLPWTLVTATNVARNVRRGTQRYRRLIDALPRPVDAAVPVESDLSPAMHDALTALRASDLEILVLVDIEGYAVVEAAAVLGLSLAAAKSRLLRARAKVRAGLVRDTAEGGGFA
nr:RNA polymerase sigma factor [Cellulomonas sp. JH27-2]